VNKGKVVFRSVYACGFVALAVAATGASMQAAPGWFAEAVHQGSLFVAVTTGVLWACSELLTHYVSRRGILATTVAVSFAAAVVPGVYLIGAAFQGASKAVFDTWHLLSLFAVAHQMQAVVLVLGFAGIFAAAGWLFRFVSRKVSHKAQRDA
jgi:hypothetical protein